MKTDNKTLLLAGAGDLAQRTAAIMLKQGYTVWGLRRQPPATPGNIQWLSADLSQPSTLSTLPRQFSHVLYAVTPDARTPENYQAVFRAGLENLLDHLDLSALQRFVFVSSTAVYGPSDDNVDEDTLPIPSGFNGRILLDAENHLHKRLPNKAVVLRPSGLYGPGRTQLLDRLRQGLVEIPTPTTNQTTAISWANRFHIDDAASACAHLLTIELPLPCYIGSDDHPWPIDQLYGQLAAMLGAPAPRISNKSDVNTGKRLLNARLRASGLQLQWPDAIAGYRALITDTPD